MEKKDKEKIAVVHAFTGTLPKTSARQVLEEAQKYTRNPGGGQKLTWFKLVEKDLEQVKMLVVGGGGRVAVTHDTLANNRSSCLAGRPW